MAIYHLHAKIIGRSCGRSAAGAAAYRSGERITDIRTGTIFDFTKRKHVVWRAIAAPDEASEWVCNREKLWQAVDSYDKRRDAQLARELELSIPVELSLATSQMLIAEFVSSEFVARGMVADIAVHDNPGNPHCHILLTLRELLQNGFGKKVRAWNDRELLNAWRESWARLCNRALEREGISQRIDHRSLIAQGCQRVAGKHHGISRAKLMRNLQRRKQKNKNSHQENTHERKTLRDALNSEYFGGNTHMPAHQPEHAVAFQVDEVDYVEHVKKRLQKITTDHSKSEKQESEKYESFDSSKPKTPPR